MKLEPVERRLFTDAYLKSLKPAPKGTRYMKADTQVPALRARVTAKGTVTLGGYDRWNGPDKSPTFKALGEFPDEIGLKGGRDKLRQWQEALRNGKNPWAVEQGALTFGNAMEMWLATRVSTFRRATKVTLEVRNHILPRWEERPLASISRSEVVVWIDELAAKGLKWQPHNLFSVLRTFYNWAVDREYVQHSPCDRVSVSKLIGPKRPRERTLTDDELRAVWKATDRMGYPWGSFYQLLLLTGARVSEVGGMRWSEIDMDAALWRLPPERFKMGRTHVVPLSDDAMAILRSLKRWEGSDYVLSCTAGRAPLKAFNRGAATLKKLVTAELGTEPTFVAHDMRRTVRTRMAGLGVQYEVAEAVIGHGQQGIARVYNHYGYEREIRQALQRWERRLRAIVSADKAKVVPLRRA